MKKQDQKQAVNSEIERRAAVSGVPPELYVYEMDTHCSDEGGPRDFVPVKESEMLMLGSDHFDRSLWPSLLRSALQDGVPIALAPDDSRIYRDGRTPLTDCCGWGSGEEHLLILSERANAALGPFLRQTCRPVPVTCTTAPLFGYSLQAVEDVLDVNKSQANWNISHITEYAIHTEKLGRSPIFRIPQHHWQILVLQPFVDAVQQHMLTGYRYKRVWPHASIPVVVTVAVKKLPRIAKDKRREPKLSTTGKKAATDFLEGLLGAPLTGDDGKPGVLFGYRLPELSLPSGSIVAADLLLSEEKPFARRVKAGDYPLTLVAARVGGERDERIAFAVVQFGDNPVATWEVAVVGESGGKKPVKSDDQGYGVDSGAGGLCDAGAQEALLALADPEGTHMKRLEKEMKKTYRHTRSWVHVQTEGGSAAIFSSGYGDGQYLSYFGLDRAGEPVALVTDFEILNWPRRPELT
jgi:hypothetical protein